MNYSSSVTTKGQVTIPHEMRKKAGIEPGKKVQFEQNEDGTIVVKPIRDILDLYGIFKSKKKYSKAAARRAYIPDVIAGKYNITMVVDTDVLIRYFTKDDIGKALQFKKRLESSEKFFVSDVTFAEVFWTLKSFYKFNKEKILDALEIFISSKNILCNKVVMLKTIYVIRNHNLSFVDAYTASFSFLENDAHVLSFDQGYDKVEGITRVEP